MNVKLGKYNQLKVVKEVDFGVYLDGDDDGEILLPARYVPDGCKPDDVLNVIDENKWKESPTLGEYLILYPDCKTERGIRCVHCGSGSLRNWGVLSERDERRVFVCNHCGQRLYRSSV